MNGKIGAAKNRKTEQEEGSPPLVSIILATFNERENIANTIEGIFENVRAPVEVVVVDDASPDETWRLVEEMNDPRITLVCRTKTRGLASAFMRGIIESRGTIVGWMDADACMPPSLLPEMIAKLEDNDVVIGSRYVPGGEDRRHPLRAIASLAINGLATVVLGHGIRDYDSGFIVLKREVFDYAIPVHRGYGEYFIEFIYTCCKKGLRVCEVPFVFSDRAHGVSKSFEGLLGFIFLGSHYVMRILLTRLRGVD